VANKSSNSGFSTKKSEKISVNFALGKVGSSGATTANFDQDGHRTSKSYALPTIKLLNPELYKQMERQSKQIQDPTFQSMKNLKERYGYRELRQQRIQKRMDEVTKELEQKNEEKIKKEKLKMLKQTA
jgi:hypothetical protein